MTLPVEPSLVERRLLLRQRLLTQRMLLAQELGPVPATRSAYPRSITMRLITQQPALVARVLVGVLGFLKSRRR